MNEETMEKMREMEDILLEIVRGAKQEANRPGVLKPVALEAAKVLTELFWIEKQIGKEEK